MNQPCTDDDLSAGNLEYDSNSDYMYDVDGDDDEKEQEEQDDEDKNKDKSTSNDGNEEQDTSRKRKANDDDQTIAMSLYRKKIKMMSDIDKKELVDEAEQVVVQSRLVLDTFDDGIPGEFLFEKLEEYNVELISYLDDEKGITDQRIPLLDLINVIKKNMKEVQSFFFGNVIHSRMTK